MDCKTTERPIRAGARVRWGVLGAGAVAHLFAEGLSSVPDARLQAVASRDGARARAFASRWGGRRAHDSYRALVEDPEVDVVYIATRNEHHREHCLLALEAGKPVLCEKPFGLDAAEVRDVVEAARRRGLFCMEAMWMRLAPATREAVALARSGDLGDLQLLSAQIGFAAARWPGDDRLSASRGGGALLDLGVYPLSLAQALLGRPERVVATVALGPSGVDEQASAVLHYGGGRQAVVAVSLRTRLGNAATLHGTRAVLELSPLWFPQRLRASAVAPASPPARGGPSRVRVMLRRRRWLRALAEAVPRGAGRTRVLRPPGNGYDVEAREVGRCLREGLLESPHLPLSDTLATLETLDEIRSAAGASRGVNT